MKQTNRRRRSIRSKQTRRRRNLRGGSVHKLPNVNTIRDTPLNQGKSALDKFMEMYDVFFVAAHGSILDTNYDVPYNPETYVMNLSPAGCNLIHSDELERKFYKKSKDPSVQLGTFEDEFWDFLNPEYGPGKKPIFYNPLNQASIEEETVAIYLPNEKVPDNSLNFENTNFIAGLGVFKVPISEEFLQKKIGYDEYFDKLRMNNKISPQDKFLRMNMTKKQMDDELFKSKDNLFKTILARRRKKGIQDPYKMTVSDLLQQDELKPTAGKKRLVILQTCRGFDETALTLYEKLVKKPLIRRASISRRGIIPTIPLPEPIPTTATVTSIKPKQQTQTTLFKKGFLFPAKPTAATAPTAPTAAKPTAAPTPFGFDRNPFLVKPKT